MWVARAVVKLLVQAVSLSSEQYPRTQSAGGKQAIFRRYFAKLHDESFTVLSQKLFVAPVDEQFAASAAQMSGTSRR